MKVIRDHKSKVVDSRKSMHGLDKINEYEDGLIMWTDKT
jgi:hypothetical protein